MERNAARQRTSFIWIRVEFAEVRVWGDDHLEGIATDRHSEVTYETLAYNPVSGFVMFVSVENRRHRTERLSPKHEHTLVYSYVNTRPRDAPSSA